ncbi:MAG: hypothetical protein OSJ60_11120 [Lachnospiraceae bacterium]|nr:hypothetical protein [Lachnospiraceae bacterium]
MKGYLIIRTFMNIKSFAKAYRKGGYTIVLDDADTDIEKHVYSIGYILDCIAFYADDGIRFCNFGS